MFSYDIELTKTDLESLMLWNHRAFKKNDDSTQSDKNTLIKLQAMMLIESENDDDSIVSRFRRRRR